MVPGAITSCGLLRRNRQSTPCLDIRFIFCFHLLDLVVEVGYPELGLETHTFHLSGFDLHVVQPAGCRVQRQ